MPAVLPVYSDMQIGKINFANRVVFFKKSLIVKYKMGVVILKCLETIGIVNSKRA